MVTPVETRTYLIWLEDDGIVRVTAKPHVTITLEDAKVCVRTIREVCGGKLTPSLVDITGIVEIDREARLYFAGEDGSVRVVKAGPKFEVLAANDLGDPSPASPAVADGRLYLKGRDFLYCIGN